MLHSKAIGASFGCYLEYCVFLTSYMFAVGGVEWPCWIYAVML